MSQSSSPAVAGAPPTSSSPGSMPTRRRGSLAPTLLLLVTGLLLGGLLTGCGKKDEAPPQARAAAAGQGGGGRPGGGAPGRPAQPAIPVAVQASWTGPISSFYAATATLEAENQAEILARVSGVVTALRAEEGDVVREGDVLLEIEDQEYRLRLAQAQATAVNQKARHDRLEGMFQQGLASAEEYETVRNDYKNAEAEEGLARLNLSYCKVTAPFGGKLVSRMVNSGQSVNTGTPLFTLADFDPLLAKVFVPAREFRKLKRDQVVELVLDSDGRRIQGRIKLVSPIIDPQSGTIKVTVEIPEYPAGIRPGDFAEVRIVTERRPEATLVPRIAVVTEKGEQVLYVARPDSTAERRVVEVGFLDEDHAQIVEGLTTGEPVVVKGQRSLKDGVPLKILEDDSADSPQAAQAES